jgi:outer membrane protein assembly factor BamB
MIDAYTGKSICRIANVSAPSFSFFGFGGGGTEVYGLDGSICYYNAVNYGTGANPNYYLQIWNNTDVDTLIATRTGTTAWQWRPSGGGFGGGPGLRADYYVHDGNTGFSLNVSIPNVAGLSVQAIREGDLIIYGALGANDEDGEVPGKMLAINLDASRGTVGSQMYQTTFVQPFLSKSLNLSSGFFGTGISMTGVDPDDGVILLQCPKLLKRWGYSLTTGEQLWESEPEPQNNYYTMISNIYQGKLLTAGYGGVILAYNITTGEIVWNYTASNVGFESPYGNYPINMFAIADGKIYTLTGEHSITQPMWRGPNLRCINATDGSEIFKILMFSANGGAHLTGQYFQMADGHLVGLNFFDNQIYCFGKGDSATTVSAPQLIPTVGDGVMLTGTVTDQTPTGRRNTNDKFDFSLKGTPAISDEDQAAWMEYMFMQQGKPENAKGVEVILETLDPNGNFYEIGRTTSDMNGNYGLKFTPEVPGDYQIFATFAGSKSYGASSSSTYMSVAEMPQASPTPTPAPPYGQTADSTILPATIGIIIAIVAIGAVLILMLRKR